MNRKGNKRTLGIGIGTTIAILALMALVTALPGAAAPGDILTQIIRPANCGGIGVAHDGTNVLYTCGMQNAIQKTDLNGANNGAISTVDTGGNPLSVDAIVWNPNSGTILGGDLGGGVCRIWDIDPNTGIGTLLFTITKPGCGYSFYDGITYNPKDKTLWLSPDISTRIYHYKMDGTEIPADEIDFAALTPPGEPDLNSGLAIGLDGNLFAGTNGFGKIVQINPGPPATFLGVFSTVTGRDEDLECGPEFKDQNGNTHETILSADLNSNKIDVLEAPKGTCVSPAVPKGSISGMKFNDRNGNGVRDAGEEGLPGWEIVLANASGVIATNITDANGNYTFPGLGADDYRVSETLQPGWVQTAPAGGVYSITLAAGANSVNNDFGNQRLPPEAACVEGVNPSGKNIPPAGSTTLPGAKGGQNEDGFYELTAKDLIDPSPQVFLKDSGSGTVFGPFASGINIKYTQAPGATPKQDESIGGPNSTVNLRITGTGDALVFAINNGKVKSKEVSCLVPPPPK